MDRLCLQGMRVLLHCYTGKECCNQCHRMTTMHREGIMKRENIIDILHRKV